MSCRFKVGGIDNPLLSDVMFYVEDTAAEARDPYKIKQMLDGKIAVLDGDTLYLRDDVMDARKEIGYINAAAQDFFGAYTNLITETREGKNVRLDIDPEVLEVMFRNTSVQFTMSEDTDIEAEGEDLTQDPLVDEVFNVQERVDNTTEKLLTNVELQIGRLERLEQKEKTKQKLRELELLKANLKKIKQGQEKISDYAEYIDYVFALAQRAEKLYDRIQQEYAVSYKTMPNEDKANILKNISDLQQTIQAFYNKDKKKSALTILKNKLDTLADTEGLKDDLLQDVRDTIKRMDALDDRYLAVAIPIQARLLLSFAPIGVNQKIDADIEFLEKALEENNLNIPFRGLERNNKQYEAIAMERNLRSGYGLLDSRQAKQNRQRRLIELNIKQLKEKRIGPARIIKELRETHQDASGFSLYTDPLVYSSDITLSLFSSAIKTGLLEGHRSTIDTKFKLRDAFYKFRDASTASERNPAEMFKDMLEVVSVYRKNKKTQKVEKTNILSIVQPFDIASYNEKQNTMFELAKEEYGYPEDVSELDDFFRSKEGRLYNQTVAEWYSKNGRPIDGAQDIIDDMLNKRDKILLARNKAYKEGRDFEARELSYQYNALDLEIKKVYRRGKGGWVITGSLTQPNDSYINPKFTNMPAATREFYDVFMEVYKEHQAKLGRRPMVQNSWDNFSYMAPAILKDAIDSFKEKKFKEGAQNAIGDVFTQNETDTEFGELIDANGEKLRVIPKYFTNTVEESKISRDIVNSLVKFVDMANRYEATAKMAGVVNVMHDSIRDRTVKELSATGIPIVDKTAQRLGFGIEKEGLGKDSRDFEHLKNFIDNVIYGESMRKQETDKILGFSKTKLYGKAASLTALSRLGFNGLQATNQLIIDSISNGSEGWARQFYSKGSHFKAQTIVNLALSDLGTSVSEAISPKFVKQSKLNQMAEMFDVFQEMGRTEDVTGSAVRKATNLNSVFILQRIPEWQTTMTKMVALALEQKGFKDKNGNIIKNKEGEEANLWDILEKDSKGQLKVRSDVANFGNKEMGMFAAKVSGMVKRTNQLKGSFDKTLIERQGALSLVALFRKFLNPAYRKRMGHRSGGYHIDVELGDITEGYYTTYYNAITAAVRGFKNDPIDSLKLLVGKSKNQNELQRQNIRRILHEQFYITMTGMITLILNGMMDDDDEYDNWYTHMAIYQMNRLQTELKAFRSVNEFGRIIESPTAAANLVKDASQLITATNNLAGYYMGWPTIEEKDVFYQRRSGKYERGDLKWVKELEDILPVISGIVKTGDPEEANKYFILSNK